MEEQKLRVLVDDDRPLSMTGARTSIEQSIRSAAGKIMEVEADALAKEMALAYSLVLESLGKLPLKQGIFRVNTVTFTLAVDATGGVSLVSALSGAVKSQAGLTFAISVGGDKLDVEVKA